MMHKPLISFLLPCIILSSLTSVCLAHNNFTKPSAAKPYNKQLHTHTLTPYLRPTLLSSRNVYSAGTIATLGCMGSAAYACYMHPNPQVIVVPAVAKNIALATSCMVLTDIAGHYGATVADHALPLSSSRIKKYIGAAVAGAAAATMLIAILNNGNIHLSLPDMLLGATIGVGGQLINEL